MADHFERLVADWECIRKDSYCVICPSDIPSFTDHPFCFFRTFSFNDNLTSFFPDDFPSGHIGRNGLRLLVALWAYVFIGHKVEKPSNHKPLLYGLVVTIKVAKGENLGY